MSRARHIVPREVREAHFRAVAARPVAPGAIACAVCRGEGMLHVTEDDQCVCPECEGSKVVTRCASCGDRDPGVDPLTGKHATCAADDVQDAIDAAAWPPGPVLPADFYGALPDTLPAPPDDDEHADWAERRPAHAPPEPGSEVAR